MKFVKIPMILFLCAVSAFAQSQNKKFEWNGYGQFRLYKINDVTEGFMIRRAKLWVKGQVPYSQDFRYKVMGIFSYNHAGYFGLLDAYGDYIFGNGYLRFGQQIPEFSLQREQPDWKIPVMKRASVVNRMIPAAQSFARDLGIQVHWQPVKEVWQIAAGIFNGDGANLKVHSSANFLYSLRSTVKVNFTQKYSWHLGGSVMYRYADQYDFSLIFGKDNFYTGSDFRFGVEMLLILNKIEIQTEFIEANFDGQIAHGYYAYANYNFSNKDQFVLSTEQLVDLNKNTNDDPWLKAGYNHLFAGHNIKLMVSGGTQFNNNYTLATQLQLFFN
ncbi:hypothetical protein MNBD_IGNAVI01-273 [hydrothermal vent metagenome]|uniref:Phosphate-selective porin O and P n=1 Tax=hydrothermal vent metagenome TaxID=652676 RepID=A0A3B1CIX5_9ZZZZ